ncbi:hypothetical protein PSN45_002642 [Yamadazyma tenuis]|uniref:uncharacterized protein n=1 Tax=Candida tenuis TaxID=2315449 RepID=UPI00279FDCD4|nr:hypothetical protein PSN45_002642 [Yamadazyma tenuis]
MVFFPKTLLVLATALSATAKKVFIDNDEANTPTILIPLFAGWEILGVSGSFGSSSYVDSVGSHATILENYSLDSCVPLYGGASKPFLRTNETFHVWEQLYGTLVWEGAWSPYYTDSYTWKDFSYNETLPGAIAMIEAVKAYKDSDPVTIFAAGTMTTVAQAISIYPNLVKEAAGLYIMGGYIDVQYAHAAGSSFQDDLVSDINIIQDPEAAQMVLTADWKKIIIGGNVTNAETPSQDLYDEMIERAGGLEEIQESPYLVGVNETVLSGNYTLNSVSTENILPFWDSVVSAFMVSPEIITHKTSVALAVDTSFNSPFYGTVRIWSHDRAPTAYKTGNVTIVDSIDQDKFYDILVDAYFQNYTNYCTGGNLTELDY